MSTSGGEFAGEDFGSAGVSVRASLP